MGREARQQQLATLIALLIVVEIILHFCWKILDAWIFEDFTVTVQLAVIAAILLVSVLFFREELVLGVFGGGRVSIRRVGRGLKSRYEHHYGGVAKAGSFGAIEALVFIAYVFCAAMLVGLISADVGIELKTIAAVTVVIAGIILLAQKAYLRFTALEMVTFAVAVLLPIMASGLIEQITLPADWLSDAWHKLAIWAASCVSCVIMAFQD